MYRLLLVMMFLFVGCVEEFEELPDAPRELVLNVVDTTEAGTVPRISPPITKPLVCNAQDYELFHNSELFSQRWSWCSREASGRKGKTVKLLTELYSIKINGMLHTELSNKCANCFGDFAACGRENCKATCIWNGTTSEACKRCGWTNCGVALEKCTGYKRTELYEYY